MVFAVPGGGGRCLTASKLRLADLFQSWSPSKYESVPLCRKRGSCLRERSFHDGKLSQMKTLFRETAGPQNPSVPSLLTMPTNPVTAQGYPSQFRALVQTIFRIVGVDRAIAYTLIGRGWSVIAGPLTLVLIARFLLPEEQGFYYTFGSVIALNIFFELGLTQVLLQFASHEKAHLEWTSLRTLSGPEVAKMRLAALLKLALKWYSVAAVLVLLLVLPAGLVFFSRNSAPNAAIAWRTPWIWLATASALNLLVAPLFAILEGCGKISQIASMRVGQSVLANLGLWVTLLCHGALFAGPVFQTINLVVGMAWLLSRYGRFFKTMLQTDVAQAPFHWWAEVWPFQWRIAISWLSGYFVVQFFTPVLFASHGPVVAGQMGMSLSLCTAVLGASIAWMTTKMSPFGVLVANKQWHDLDILFSRTLRQSLLVFFTVAVALWVSMAVLHHYRSSLSGRIVTPLAFAFLLISTMMNHIGFCEALYLRAHKTEPFVLLSVTAGVLTGSSTYLLAGPFSTLGVSAGYVMCCTLGLVWGSQIFFKKRKEWHATTP